MWLEDYVSNLSNQERKEVSRRADDTQFRFGDNSAVTSTEIVTFPGELAGQSVLIQANVNKGSLPLLLSRKAMQRAEAKLDFEDDCEYVGQRY